MRSALFLLLTSCASVSLPPPVSISYHPETRPLPPDAREEPIPPELPHMEWSLAAEPGMTLTEPGILLSEARAWRYATILTRYGELRARYKADQEIWQSHRLSYEGYAARVRESAVESSFWAKHGIEVGLVIGILVGCTTTVMVMSLLENTLGRATN